MANLIDNYFRTFRPTNALQLFALFFIAGTLFILQQWSSAFSATGCVFVYGTLLYITQSRYQIELTDTVKDSPYFLGFSLTLIALWFVFDQAAGAGPGGLSLDGLSGSIGAALGTTVAGLLSRQVLQSRGVLEEERGAILRDLRNELTRHTETFSDTQSRLVGLIEEFVSTREELFSREEQAVRNYIERIERSEQLLEEVDDTFRSRLQEFTQRINRQLDSLETAAEESRRQGVQIRESLEESLVAYRQNSKQVLENNLEQTEQLREDLTETLDANERAMRKAVSRHEARVESLGDFANKYRDAEDNAAASLRELSQDLERVRSEVQDLEDALHQLSPKIKQLPEELEGATKQLGSDAEKVTGELSQSLEQMTRDVRAIDEIVDEVVEVLQKRLRQAD